jgi:NADPH-dependent 2,4-dienoyl-CoA reductase/sulfur reductase-like enzyme
MMKLVIVGGVAGGASAAAHARRLSEQAHIVLVERGPDVSFANCGLPYYIGGEIADRSKLLVVTPERLKTRFNLDVRVRSSALSVDRQAKTVRIRDLTSGAEYDEPYDRLILSPGATRLRSAKPTARVTQVDVTRAVAILGFSQCRAARPPGPIQPRLLPGFDLTGRRLRSAARPDADAA